MIIDHDPFLSEVAEGALRSAQSFANALPQPIEVTRGDIDHLLAQPPEFKLGQAALPIHSFAKKFRQSPVKIAEAMALQMTEAAKAKAGGSYISKVDAVNGYLNFHCDFKNYGTILLKSIRKGDYFKRSLVEGRKEKILVEFAQPNTHKALHVGHLRNFVFGDSVCRILEYAGHDVVRASYPGDMGAHIAKSLWYIQKQLGSKLPTEHQADWLGEVYAKSDEYVKSHSNPEDQAKIKTEIGAVLKELQEKKGAAFELYKITREWSLQQMRDVYAWLGIKFDVWYFESECDEPSRELVVQKFKEGFFQKSEGAVGLDLSQWNLGFAMFLKSDGNGLYLTKDLELIRRKFADPAVTRSIVVVDARQRLHFQQLFKTAELMGYPQAAKSVHLSYENVTTPSGEPFSSRELNGLQLGQLRKVMEEKIILDHLHTYRGEWSDTEIYKVADEVTLGALKYGFLRVDGNSVIKFMLEEWLRLDGDTGPYLQYVHARCRSLLDKVGKPADIFKTTFETPFEEELLAHLGRFNHAALTAADGHRPAAVAGYLLELCKLYNRFYKECPVKSSEGDLKHTRLALVEASAAVLAKGLELLGIPAPQRM